MSDTLKNMLNNTCGSGYEDMRGTVINYGYTNFEDFNIGFYNNKARWHGLKGYFAGNVREVVPQVSKVADGIYFASWRAGPKGLGGDNVILNARNMRVNAHVFDAHGDGLIMHLTGEIYSINGDTAIFPNGALTSDADAFPNVQRNIKEKNLPPMDYRNTVSDFEEDAQARKELDNKNIAYTSPHGVVVITFKDDIIYVTKENSVAKEFTNTATKIADNIYFLSWEDKMETGIDHANIVINFQTKKVFSHIHPDGTRQEEISDLM